jgi:hypothetical protein
MSNLLIACTLDATNLKDRLAEMHAVGEAAVLTAETTGNKAVLRFRASDATHERLAAIVAAESECCAFLSLDLRDEHEQLALTIEAPEGGEPVMHELVAAFAGTSETAA